MSCLSRVVKCFYLTLVVDMEAGWVAKRVPHLFLPQQLQHLAKTSVAHHLCGVIREYEDVVTFLLHCVMPAQP